MSYEQTIVLPMRVDYTPVFREIYKLVNIYRKQGDLVVQGAEETDKLRHTRATEQPIIKSQTLGRHIDVIA